MLKLFTIWVLLFSSREEIEMMAMLWAQQIMLGKKTFDQVPRLLRDKVCELLVDSGMGALAAE